MYVFTNPNPCGKFVGDCVIRGISIFLDKSWDDVHDDLCDLSKEMCDMPSSNDVWDTYLLENGCDKFVSTYYRSIKEFANDHPIGRYLLATGTHVVAVIDGDYFDIADSGLEIPMYYYRKE